MTLAGDHRGSLARTRHVLALVVGLVALAPAAVQVWLAVASERAAMRVEAELKVAMVNQIVSARPDLWRFEEYRFNHLLRVVPPGPGESVRILDSKGQVVAAEGDFSPIAALTVVVPILDGGAKVGELVLRHGLQELAPGLMIALTVGLILGLAVYVSVDRLHLQAVNRTEETLYRQRDAEAAQRRAAEAQLLQARKLEALGTLASGMAHSLNNMLTPITILGDLLREEAPEGSRQREMLDRICQSAERATHLVSSVLAFGRRGEARTQTLPASRVVEEVVAMARDVLPTGIVLDAVVPRDAGWVAVDLPQIQAALLNLISNAIDAMRGVGGTVALTLVREELGDASAPVLAELPPGSYAVIRVADTGTGMSPEVAERIFEPFFTTKEAGRGTGLGLSSTYGIVRSHGGIVTLDSRFGQGTTFTLYLPTRPPPAESS
ncbi:MAG: ATP-binding protein [Magnetospirillum sp. WYHS-4]